MLRKHLELTQSLRRSGKDPSFPKEAVADELRGALRRYAPYAMRRLEAGQVGGTYEGRCIDSILEKYPDVIATLSAAFANVLGRSLITDTVVQTKAECCPNPAQYFQGPDRSLDWQRQSVFSHLRRRGLMTITKNEAGVRVWGPTLKGRQQGLHSETGSALEKVVMLCGVASPK